MSTEANENAELAMESAIDAVRRRLGQIRTGKASPVILDGVMVDYYGAPTPLKQLATIAVPEPRLLAVKPFDRSAIGEIEKAIQSSNLGLNPANDGMMIRLQIPELTEDTRIHCHFVSLGRRSCVAQEHSGRPSGNTGRQEADPVAMTS